MACSYLYIERFTTPFINNPLTPELCAAKLTDHHLRYDAEQKRWWCYDKRNWDQCYFYGWGFTREEAYAMCQQRLDYFLRNTVEDIRGKLQPFKLNWSPYFGQGAFLAPMTTARLQ